MIFVALRRCCKLVSFFTFNNNNNSKIIRQCLWCCIHVTAIARVHPVYLSVKSSSERQTKPVDLGRESASMLLLSTPTIVIYYYYSALSWRSSSARCWCGYWWVCCPMKGRWLSWQWWLVTYWVALLAHRWSPILVLTTPSVEQLCCSRPARCH